MMRQPERVLVPDTLVPGLASHCPAPSRRSILLQRCYPPYALAWSCSHVTAANDLFRHRSDRRGTTAMPEDDLAPVGILPRPLQCGPTSSRMPVRASFRAELGIAAPNGTSSLRRPPLIECARAPSRRACAQPDRLRHRSNQPATLSGRALAVASSPCVGTVLAYGLSRRPQVAPGDV
jgi:hypothetical protein